MSYKLHHRVNPEMSIPESASAIHGITNESVKDCKTFKQLASEILDFFKGCDVGGFNIGYFDIPLLSEEFLRAGLDWDISNIRVFDSCVIFKKKEERTLSAASQFYLNEELQSAHSALNDVEASIKVFQAQLNKYDDLKGMSSYELAAYSSYTSNSLDPACKIGKDEQGEAIYLFGKNKGLRVKDEPGFAEWMLSKDFPLTTKKVIRQILGR
jgi:DNA polymerase-3 subunit epsilon